MPSHLSPSSSSAYSLPSHSSTSSLLSPSSLPPLPPPPPSCFTHAITHTLKGQSVIDTIKLQDEWLAARQLKGSHPQQILSAISDYFVSFFATDNLLPTWLTSISMSMMLSPPFFSLLLLIIITFSINTSMTFTKHQNLIMKPWLNPMLMFCKHLCYMTLTILRNKRHSNWQPFILITTLLVFNGAMHTSLTTTALSLKTRKRLIWLHRNSVNILKTMGQLTHLSPKLLTFSLL